MHGIDYDLANVIQAERRAEAAQARLATLTPGTVWNSESAPFRALARWLGASMSNRSRLTRVRRVLASVYSAFNPRDAQGATRYRAAVDGVGNPTVQLFDAQGNVTWSAP
jgi:hypothetical protein